MKDVTIDYMGVDSGRGEVAKMIMTNGINPGLMRPFLNKNGQPRVAVYTGGDPNLNTSWKSVPVTNATLRRDEWKTLDEAILKARDYRLGGIQDLINAGLTYNLNSGMGSTVLEYHDVSDALTAELSMDGVTRGKNDAPDFGVHYLPLPIIHADYQINTRVLQNSRNMGNGIDTTLAERATRRIMEKLENMLFTNTTYGFGGGKIYSYVNFPHRNTKTMTTKWDEMTPTSAGKSVGEQIVDEVIACKQALINKRFMGPYHLYIPSNYETLLDKDYDTTRGNTIRDRLLALNNINAISVSDTLSEDNVLLVQMTVDVVRLVNAMAPTNVEWKTEGGMLNHYKVMAIQVPQLRADSANRSGILHLAPAS